MATIEELTYWNEATESYKKGDLKNALELMRQVGSCAKILFNIGMIYLQTRDYESSEIMFSQSLRQDEYLCVGYLQKGYCLFMVNDFDTALKCFTFSLQLLLDNDCIDYSQLGLDFKLCRCELLYNMAICHEQLGNERDYSRFIREASDSIRTNQHRSLIEGGRNGRDIHVYFLSSKIFQVPACKVQNLKKKEFLKEAKVIITDASEDSFVGFSGATLLEPVLESLGNTLVRKKSEPLNSFGSLSRGLSHHKTTPEITKSHTLRIPKIKVKDILPEQPLKEFNDQREREREQFDRMQRPRRGLEQRRPSEPVLSRNASDGFISPGNRNTTSKGRNGKGTLKRLVARKSSLPEGRFGTTRDLPPSPVHSRMTRRDVPPSPISPRVKRPDQKEMFGRDRDLPKRQNSQTESPTDSGYEDTKTKLKIHTDSATVAMNVHTHISLSQLTHMVSEKLNLDDTYYASNAGGGVKLSFVDEEDPDAMISLVDDGDVAMALGNGRGVVHLYLQDGDVLDLY
jgi:tetratricopeptide (TPR) repeat protein